MNILLIRLGRIGDIVLSLGVANAIKKTFPNSIITLLTDEKARDITIGQKNINNVIYWNRTFWKKIPKIKAIVNIIKSVFELRKRKFDTVVDLQGFFETALISYLTGAKKRIGYNEKGRGIFYNIKVEPWFTARHDFDMQLKLASVIDVNTDNIVPSINITKESRDYRDKFLSSIGINDSDKIIGINPSASVYYKRWKEENFANLSDKLVEKYRVKIIIFWGPGEKEIAENVINSMRNKEVLCCSANLMELSAFIERCSVFITNDSGPMHIASAIGTPVIAIFIEGHSSVDTSGPIGDKNRVFMTNQSSTKEEDNKTIEKIVNPVEGILRTVPLF